MPLTCERNCDIRRMIWIHAGDIWLISWPAKFCPPAPRTKTLHASHYQWNSILCTISLSSCNHIPHAHFNIRPGYLKKWVTAHDSRGFNGLLQCIELVELVCTSRWHIWVILSSDPQFDDTFDHGEYPSRFYTHDICIHRSEKRISPIDFLICTSPLTRPRARGITLKMKLS